MEPRRVCTSQLCTVTIACISALQCTRPTRPFFLRRADFLIVLHDDPRMLLFVGFEPTIKRKMV